jgi:transposase
MMGETLRPDATPPASKTLGKMQELVRARQAALADRTAMQNRMGESTCDAVRESLNAVIEAINSAVAKLDAEIAKLIAGDGGLSRRMEILVSIPGVGPVTAASLIADLPELGECDDKAIAALVGVAPFAADSGDFRGQRRIRGGRSALRSTVYMAAVAAARSNPDMKRVYERLKAAGKASKVALTAVMRKLVILANALVKTDRKWTPRTA